MQLTPRNKVNVHLDWQIPCNGAAATRQAEACRNQPESGAVIGSLGLGGLTATSSPEIAGNLRTLVKNRQYTWSSTVTNRLLLEAGLGTYMAKWGPFEAPGNPTRDLVRVTELTARNGAVAGLNYRSANWANNFDNPNTWRTSASYVTGSHNYKVGYIGGFLREDIRNNGNVHNLTYTFLNGRPNALTQTLRAFTQKDRVRYNAFYLQDQWSLGRVTLQGALRYDHAWSYSPEQVIGPTNFLATELRFPRTPGVSAYKDLSPRGGAAIDIFGNGMTSVKINFGKYLEPAANLSGNYSISNPIARISTTANRTWTDPNGDFTPQCNLQSPAANGECGAMNNQTFGTPTQITAGIDPAILNGLNVRPGDWQIGASVQQQLFPRVSVEVGYFRRWLTHFTTTDNLALGAGDFTPFSLTAPSDPRLPNGGGYAVGGLYNVTPAGFTTPARNNVTFADQYGGITQVYNGFLANVSARGANGLTLTAGINSGRTVNDLCAVRSQIPELVVGGNTTPVGPTNPNCLVDPGFVTKITGLGSYNLPKIDTLIAFTLRSDQGAPLRATWNAPVALVSAALGRPAAAAGTTIPVDLVKPGDVWGDRVNEVDLRFAKIVRFRGTRTHVGVDIFNILNSNAILTYNQTFTPGGAWLAPQSVLTPRFLKVSAQIDF